MIVVKIGEIASSPLPQLLLSLLKASLWNLREYPVKITDLEKVSLPKKDSEPENGKVWYLMSPLIPSGRSFQTNTIDK